MRFVPIVALLATLLAAAGCQGTFGDPPGEHRMEPGENGVGESAVPACPIDPDCHIGGDCSQYECPDYWLCEDHPTGKRCTNPGPDYPGEGGDWECEDMGDRTVCRGSDFPDGGGDGDWDCERTAEFVVCRDDSPDYPDEGGDGPWDCWFEGEFRVCTDDGGGPGDGGDSECVPGVQRWCDDAVYCSWGKQTCLPDGTWGRCVEPTVTRDGLTDRPNTACGCRYFYFNDECCEDQEDRDHDGKPDCLIPEDHSPPACPSDGSLCSYCDAHSDCGSSTDLCLFARDGYALCSRDCSDSSCPSGYSCERVGTRSGTVSQCVPDGGTCE